MNRERIAADCICCGGSDLNRSSAVLMPFVAKRVFGHEPVEITAEWGLRDLQPGMAYSLCNSLQCTGCGALFLDLRFSDRELAALYAGYRDEEYTRLREHFEPGYRELSAFFGERSGYIARIEEFLRPLVAPHPALLDWGGDTGINTPLRLSARSVHIYDISDQPCIAGTQAVDLATLRQSSYDLIICSQVLEHIPYPLELLTEIASVMGQGSLLYLEVPYEGLMQTEPDSRELHRSKRHWHEHVNFFSEAALRSLVQRAGLSPVQLETIDISLDWRNSCVFSLLCRLS